MLLDKVLNENEILSEENINFDEFELMDVYTECAVEFERIYNEFMLEQAKDEFKQYVNEGVINESVESIKEKLKKLIEKIKEIINRLKDKVKKVLEDYRLRSITYFNKNKEAIEKGASLVKNFMGYEDFKGYNALEEVLKATLVKYGNIRKDVESASTKEEIIKTYNDIGGSSSSIGAKIGGKISAKIGIYILKGEKKNISYTFNEIETIFSDRSAYNMYTNNIDKLVKLCDDMENQIKSEKTDDELLVYKNRCYVNIVRVVASVAKEFSKASVIVLTQGFKYMKAAVSAATSNA